MKGRVDQLKLLAERRCTASATTELVVVIILLVPIALVALNMAFLALAAFYADAACREAARAASQQTSAESARNAATAAVKKYAAPIGSPSITRFRFNFKNSEPDPVAPLAYPSIPIEVPDLKARDNLALASGTGSAATGEAPNVVVEVSLRVGIPAPIFLGDGDPDKATVDVSSRYVFPLIGGVEDPNDDGSDSAPSDEPPQQADDPPPPIQSDPEP